MDRFYGINKGPLLSTTRTLEGSEESTDPHISDPGLLQKQSLFRSYTTSFGTYKSLRVFYRHHPQADKLPNKPHPIPLLVFVHGLGGSVAQFNPLLSSLVNLGPCLAVDMPGCGRSDFHPRTWDAYSVPALAELLNLVIGEHVDTENGQGVILVGHSMGCSLSALLASGKSVPQLRPKYNILGFVAICPKVSPMTPKQASFLRILLRIPTPLFDLLRRWDQRGGLKSASITRLVGKDADVETRRLQRKFNAQSRTGVWRRMARALIPNPSDPSVNLPGPSIWAGIEAPLYVIAGQDDTVTSPTEVVVISEALGSSHHRHSLLIPSQQDPLPETTAPLLQPLSNDEEVSDASSQAAPCVANEKHVTSVMESSGDRMMDLKESTMATKSSHVFRSSILPSPATHALLYSTSTYRTLSGLIQNFLPQHVDHRLSLGWQLQHLTTEGKWDVKNLEKWQAVKRVSEPIGGIFRGMKTLREVDDTHSPKIFAGNWKDRVKAVIDISYEAPVYDPQGLEAGGISYYKLPTVSKFPPTINEVKEFSELVDRVRGDSANDEDKRLIGVHCHYGFNRTGFFICSYLIAREGCGVQAALDEFKERRPPGIRHEHFIDTLFMRYCVGLKKTPGE
ncbi:hypothetical protein MMC25_003016 [Agyrium rufum]|nr:hypothetical protein [Agyrium rufum]